MTTVGHVAKGGSLTGTGLSQFLPVIGTKLIRGQGADGHRSTSMSVRSSALGTLNWQIT